MPAGAQVAMQSFLILSYFHMSNIWHFCPAHWPSKTFFEIVKSPYWFDILFNYTSIKSLNETKILSFNKVFNSLSLIHLLFRIMILIQWSVNISVFVNHVVIVFWGPNEGDRKRTYIPRLFSEYMLKKKIRKN
jgi:hypothetical protein